MLCPCSSTIEEARRPLGFRSCEEPKKPEELLPTVFGTDLAEPGWEPLAEGSELDGPQQEVCSSASEQAVKNLSTEMVVDAFESCTEFRDPSLRRGVPISKVFEGVGRIFADSRGSAETFCMSRPVERLDYFISHNWSTGRFAKYLALAYHFNFRSAAVLATIGGSIVGVLIRARLAPSGLALPTCQLLFWAAVFRKRHLGTAFLDKVCIHQEDPDMQRQGIEGLSAYLRISGEMLILYTGTYLSRLWTVYELASMIILQPSARITVVPTSLVFSLSAFLIVFGTIMSCARPLATWTPRLSNFGTTGLEAGSSVVIPGFLSVVAFSGIAMCRKLARDRTTAELKAESFRIREAACAVETDRQTVHRNVSAMMRKCDLVPRDADESLCLDTFDLLARRLVPVYLRSTWALAALPERCVMSLWPFVLGLTLDLPLFDGVPVTPRNDIVLAIFVATSTFALTPIMFAFFAWASRFGLHLQGLAGVAFFVLLSLGAALCLYLLFGVYAFLAAAYWVTQWEGFFWANIAALFLAFGAVAYIYAPFCRRMRGLRVRRTEELREDVRRETFCLKKRASASREALA